MGHTPWVAGLLFLKVTLRGFFISLFLWHFIQYACIYLPPLFGTHNKPYPHAMSIVRQCHTTNNRGVTNAWTTIAWNVWSPMLACSYQAYLPHRLSYHLRCSSPATLRYLAVVLKLTWPRCSWSNRMHQIPWTEIDMWLIRRWPEIDYEVMWSCLRIRLLDLRKGSLFVKSASKKYPWGDSNARHAV